MILEKDLRIHRRHRDTEGRMIWEEWVLHQQGDRWISPNLIAPLSLCASCFSNCGN